jgi:hypothetical protein
MLYDDHPLVIEWHRSAHLAILHGQQCVQLAIGMETMPHRIETEHAIGVGKGDPIRQRQRRDWPRG